MKGAGKYTPVWRNTVTGKVTCGKIPPEGLDGEWEQVTSLPPEERLVIRDGRVLPQNDLTRVIARVATQPGVRSIAGTRRGYVINVIYVDSVRVIIK